MAGSLAFAALALAGGPALAACPGTPSVEADVVSVAENGEITLTDGIVIRLPQLDGVTGEALLSSGLTPGTRVRHVRVRTEPDRWGRMIARVMLSSTVALSTSSPADAPSRWLERLIIDAGLARVRVSDAGRDCAGPLIAAEAVARRAKRGLWQRDGMVLPAGDVPAIAASLGDHAIVFGRVLSVGEREQRTYLNFGRRWSEDFTASLPRTLWSQLKARGVDATSLTGKTVRVRGMVETSGGPMIQVTFAEQLEILD